MSIDTRTEAGRLWKHEKFASDEAGHRALTLALAQQRELGRTVIEDRDGCRIVNATGVLLLQIVVRKSKD